jgi:DNA polymerase I-like protein with 3'-5' exonuclease and polymerase domains
MDDLPTHLFDADVIAVDLETRDPNIKRGAGWARRDGYIVGVALGSAAGSHYLPIRHEGGGNMDPDRVLEFVADLCSTQIPKVMHNSMYDRGWLKAEGVDVKGRVYDTMFAAALLDENRFSYSLDNVAVDWCGIGKDETELNAAVAQAFGKKAKAKENLWRLPGGLVRRYAEGDVEATLALWKYEEPLLRQEGLWKLFELECDLVPLLLEMRMRGIRVDLDKAEQTGTRLKEMEDAVHADIYRQWGVKVDVWAAASVARAADTVGLPYPRTPKTKAPSFSKEWLAAHQHPLMQAILRLRRLEKTRGTFVTNMILEHQVNGRIHCELHPLRSDDGGTVSGRLSCSNPNLQQTSARDPELGPMVRGLFLPEPGCLWGAYDYSSQEPRLTVHFAAETNQAGSAEAVAGYRADERMDYHQMVADMANISRKHAKVVNLGLAYGMGGVKLCSNLGLPTEIKNGRAAPGEEALDLLQKYHAAVPFVKGVSALAARLAEQRGWIRTYGGRLCRFDRWEPIRKPPGWEFEALKQRDAVAKYGKGNIKRSFTHKALNRLIQGSAADMTKMAMLEMYKEGIVPMHQMHDELDISVSDPVTARRISEIMRDCVQLQVPIVVDAEFGETWGTATKSYEEVFG